MKLIAIAISAVLFVGIVLATSGKDGKSAQANETQSSSKRNGKLFSFGCGQTSSENCTYFESAGGVTAGPCRLEICKCSSDICQLRLDFNQFIITGPASDTHTKGVTTLFGVVAAGAKAVTDMGRCLTDTFVVTNPGGITPPSLCGINTGEHMYVDANDACNDLTFQLGNQALGTGIATRQWSIKINQYSCDYNNLAPDGCTQYFFGSSSQQVQTYNYGGGQHLNNQEQVICVRRERGNCRICWMTQMKEDFEVSSAFNAIAPMHMGYVDAATADCCGYGAGGVMTKGYDCVRIPGALKPMTTTAMGPSQICGRVGLVTAMGDTAATVCSDRTPFQIRFSSDEYEFEMEAGGANAGFRLIYIQSASNC